MRGRLPAVATLAAALLCGIVFSRLGVPLPFVLGPLFATAAASLMGVQVFSSRRGRQAGQLVVGTAIGLRLTAEATVLILVWFPLMVASAFVSMLVTALLCVPFARASRVDTATAFFALTPGGLSEMAHVGSREGASPEPITVTQTIRIALLVSVLPSLLLLWGTDGGFADTGARPVLSPLMFAGVLAATYLTARAVTLIGANNPWMIGGLIGAGILAGSGLVEGRAPALLFAAGQFLIGISIGAQFRRESVLALPRVCLVAVAFIALSTLSLFVWALAMTGMTDIDISTTTLGAAPGGMAEMTLTAQILHLNVGLIAAFHVVRSFVVNGYSRQFFRLFRRIRLFEVAETVMDRLAARRRS